jgi:mRNA interferase RelE/StbE
VGEYRVLYQVHDEVLVVLVIRVAHRKDVYRNL